ncbi:hypothetical protein CW749_23855 [Vibrio sp. vnigr-6D03]|uniref:lipid A deacylase LpxR family protein n=1 Tax=Vibrio sp. vnigr-6D03 TaxID=2058088 RepID=UPI000C32C32A|nr:lipid A deacylase LpxR family protein [Vibrio sp. vnigr-6D03]PKF77048.1 hypothetical protein CW749_23855 [Vibrio sp. vnigr-6D03]
MNAVWVPIILLSLSSLTAQAKSHLSLTMDNDSLVRSDEDYSSGIQLGILSELDKNESSEQSHSLSTIGFGDNNARFYWNLNVGQKLWTPTDIESTTPKINERPYSGISFISGSLIARTTEKHQTLHAMLGTMGKNAQADSAQVFVHDLIGSARPQGWAYQIEEPWVYQLGYRQQNLLHRNSGYFENHESEVSWINRVALGNFRSEIGSGVMWRMGEALANTFGSAEIKYDNPAHRLHLDYGRSGWFVFTGLEARYRFNDITITGKRPPLVPLVSVTHLQSTAVLGALAHYKEVGVSLSYSLKTPDFKEDQAHFHANGSVSLFWIF